MEKRRPDLGQARLFTRTKEQYPAAQLVDILEACGSVIQVKS